MPAYRAKGDLEVLEVPGCPGLILTIRHVGPGLAQRWAYRLRGVQIEEMARVVQLRRQIPREAWPDLHDWRVGDPRTGFVLTEEGMHAFEALCREVLGDCLEEVTGDLVDGRGDDPVEVVAELGQLELAYVLANSAQSLTLPEVFAEGPRDGQLDGPTAEQRGPDDRGRGGGAAEPPG